jgi:hypothetical protein
MLDVFDVEARIMSQSDMIFKISSSTSDFAFLLSPSGKSGASKQNHYDLSFII